MHKRKKRHRLPHWIRSQEFRLLNNSEKDFLGYLYSFGPDTCWLWNWRLQKKFHRSRRTIQRWLAKLKDLGFVWIEKPYGPERKIHSRTLPSPEHWLKLLCALSLGKNVRKHKRPRSGSRVPIQAVHDWSSTAFIERTKHDIVNELLRRGESLETAAKVADIVIQKQLKEAPKKKG